MITHCPCCDWFGYKTAPKDEDSAILACPMCTISLTGERSLCSKAKEVQARRDAERGKRWSLLNVALSVIGCGR